ncbi:MAG: hypothetical protein ACXVDN_21290, partial [Ktedonobacteraceae bacterium]
LYHSVRLWQLQSGASPRELVALAASGMLEMMCWIPGFSSLSLVRLDGEPIGRYLIITNFTDREAYQRWLQIEEEGPGYWELYASIMMYWEQMATMILLDQGEVLGDFAGQSLPEM